MTPDQLKSLRALCEAATPSKGGHTSRDIDPQNPVWGPRLQAFKDAVWPEGVIALINGFELVDTLKAIIETQSNEKTALRAQLSAMTAARDEACALIQLLRDTHEPDAGAFAIATLACLVFVEVAVDRADELRKVGQP